MHYDHDYSAISMLCISIMLYGCVLLIVSQACWGASKVSTPPGPLREPSALGLYDTYTAVQPSSGVLFLLHSAQVHL